MDNDHTHFVRETESEETIEEENFEALLNQSVVTPVRLNPGEKVGAAILKITDQWVFIDIGGKSEGLISIDEYKDSDGNITVREGETITAYLLSSRNNENFFTTRLTGSAGGGEYLEEAFHSGIPIEGVVEKEIKGGFDVRIAGSRRAFCPYSQMGLRRVEHAEQFIGSNLIFKITEYREGGRNIVVSNRAVLEDDRREQKDELKKSLREGMTVTGEITSIRKFGAFVDIGGIEGLIPISEIAWGRVEDVASVLSVGQRVNVAVQKLDWEQDKFSFSLKKVMTDPWDNIELKYPEGSCHQGTVSRLAPFGAFVTLEPGVDGLVHISELSKDKRISHPREVVHENQTIEVRIGGVDADKKRLSLTLISGEQSREEVNDYREHMAGSSKKPSGSYGTLGDILRAKMSKK